MKRGIVEGEPGMFPAPVAKLFVGVNRWVRRVLRREPSQDHSPGPEQKKDEPPATA